LVNDADGGKRPLILTKPDTATTSFPAAGHVLVLSAVIGFRALFAIELRVVMRMRRTFNAVASNMTQRLTKRVTASIIAILVFGVIAAGPIMSRVEQPEYVVNASEGSIEIRAYGPMIVAEAEVMGERKAAIEEGFRLIAAYIFGANRPNAKIAMTAPVQQQRAQKIAMTAPVTQQTDGKRWTVRFVMPRTWTMDTLPTPNDTRVRLKPVAATRMVVIRFSGTANDNTIGSKTDELRKYALEHRLATVSDPVLAFYNPPWTLPFFRRNEIMLELAATRTGE
jgi:hypothetical protein